MARYGIPLILFLAMVQAGCATITNGRKQEIWIASSPSGAQVFVDGQPAGETPLVTRVIRRKRHEIRVRLDGYEEQLLVTERKSNDAVVDNVFIVGLLGVAIDYMSGAAYRVSPAHIMFRLEPIGKKGRDDSTGTGAAATQPARRPEDE